MAGAASGVIGAAVAVGGAIAEIAPTHRLCTVEIQNNCTSYSLCNPRVYFESGGCATPLSPFIASSKCGMAQFIKTAHASCGSVGVFTYNLLKKDKNEPSEKIAVMFSVPYDFNQYSNCYAVGVFDKNKECDYNLYYQMYNDSEESFIRGKASDPCLIYKDKHVTIMAAMSDAFQPVLKVQVFDK